MKKVFLIIIGLAIANQAYALADFDLLWEAETYVPPFYQGAALPSRGSTIRLVVLPSGFTSGGKIVSPEALDYRFEQDGKLLAASGVGKNSLTFTANSADGSENLRVTVTAPNNQIKLTKHLTIETVTPKIVLYPVTPWQETLWTQTLKSPLTLNFKELKLLAAPYYLATNKITSPTFSWFYNGQTITPNFREPNMITLVPPPSSSQTNRASVRITANSNILKQTVEKVLAVQF